jgi:hypothetical protein
VDISLKVPVGEGWQMLSSADYIKRELELGDADMPSNYDNQQVVSPSALLRVPPPPQLLDDLPNRLLPPTSPNA